MRSDLTMIQCTKSARAMLKAQAANRRMTMTAYLEYVLALPFPPFITIEPPTTRAEGT